MRTTVENCVTRYEPPPGLLAYPAPTQVDDARARAIRLLSDSFAYDVIDMDEFERRLGLLSTAVDAGAMHALVADLVHHGRGDASSALMSHTPIPSEGRILALMNETKRQGSWQLPHLLVIKALMSDVKLDLRHAAVPAPCIIDVAAVMANVSIIVPPNLVVEFEVMPFMATTASNARAVPGFGYSPSPVRIRGTAFMAEVRVIVRELGP